MLIFDQLKKNDPQLRLLAAVVCAGIAVLLGGLWWVQVVSARDYQATLEHQSFRTVRIPAVRGKILDRNGIALADNVPTYSVNLYLEELSSQFKKEYARIRPRRTVTNAPVFWKGWLGIKTVREEFDRLKQADRERLQVQARFNVASNLVQDVARQLGRPLALDFKDFNNHYALRRALPFPVATKLQPREIARFEEQPTRGAGLDLEVQPTRVYPYQQTASHLLGSLTRNNDSRKGEEAYFTFRLPDFRGSLGIERAFDSYLHGRAGAKSVLVNHLGYRQSESIWTQAEPGSNVVLTLDLQLQQAVEKVLAGAGVTYPPPVRGAAVVMDVRTGDVLALASSPAFDPNLYVRGFSHAEWDRILAVGAEKNRATQENYQPGSIFKPVVALACLERGLNPEAIYHVQPNPSDPSRGIVHVGNTTFRDTVRPGPYNFRRALIKSSNSYFISHGMPHIEKVIELGEQFGLGEAIGLNTWQETAGNLPSLAHVRSAYPGEIANLCIGQGAIDVTPLQMAVVASAIANGGHVLEPRLADRIELQDPLADEPVKIFPKSKVRNRINVRPATLQLMKSKMLVEGEDGYDAFRHWRHLQSMRVCGKTGTAEKKDARNQLTTHITWFMSFAPYENPRYAVVVMIEGGDSGGGTCAPLARDIYNALVEWERNGKAPAMVQR